MKNIFLKPTNFLTFLFISLMFSSCQKDENIEPKKEISFKVESTPFIYGKIYPSFIYTILSKENSKNTTFFTATIQSNIKTKITLKVEENKFTHESLENIELKEGTNEIKIQLPWKFDNFINIKKSGQTYFRFSLIGNNTKNIIGTENLQMEYRSINECVLQYIEPKTNKEEHLGGEYFCAYVNEDEPELDLFLRQTYDNKNNVASVVLNKYKVGWVGYQGGDDFTRIQVVAIIQELFSRGMTYSSISTTSSDNKGVFAQYVRFPKESLKTNQANCVDGSVLLASILQKIGIQTFLITRPGHMYMGYYIDPNDLNKIEYIETTAINTGDFNKILKGKDYWSVLDEPYVIYKMRAQGIKPIQ